MIGNLIPNIAATKGPALVSAARTANTEVFGCTRNRSFKGLFVILNITAASGTGGLRLDLLGQDQFGATQEQILHATATPRTTTGTVCLMFYPTLPLAAPTNVQTFPVILPMFFRLVVTALDASSYTYSVKTYFLP